MKGDFDRDFSIVFSEGSTIFYASAHRMEGKKEDVDFEIRDTAVRLKPLTLNAKERVKMQVIVSTPDMKEPEFDGKFIDMDMKPFGRFYGQRRLQELAYTFGSTMVLSFMSWSIGAMIVVGMNYLNDWRLFWIMALSSLFTAVSVTLGRTSYLKEIEKDDPLADKS